MPKETKRKILANWNTSKTQEDQIDALEKKTITNNPSNVLRKNSEIILAENVSVPPMEKFVISYTFDDLPEWAIPHFRLKYFFTTENGYNYEDLQVKSISNYNVWTQIGTNYVFYFVVSYSVMKDDNGNTISLFLTASLIFDNPRVFNELQFNKA